MKRLLTLLLVLAMILSCTACGGTQSGGKTTDPIIPGGELNTLNKIIANGYEASGISFGDNVFAQQVTNEKNEEYILIVKIPEELIAAVEAVDISDENSQQQYLDILGDIELTDSLNTAEAMPSKEYLDTLKGMTIAEFELGGPMISGYAGDNGEYVFFFSDDSFEYRVELEKGTKLEDYDDTYLFDEAIADLKIGNIECTGLSWTFVQTYMDNFIDPPAAAAPQDLGEAKSSLEEINQAIGSNIKAISGASEEKFSVIDGRIAQYIYFYDGYYYCIRSAADTDIQLDSDDFGEDPLKDEDGYYNTVSSQTDFFRSARFVFNGYQYAYMVYDNGEMDYMSFDALQSEFRDAVCEYEDGSLLASVLGSYSSDNNYAMSISALSDDSAQVTAYTYDEEKTQIWTMIVKENGAKLSYDKSRLEVYLSGGEGGPTKAEAGSGTLSVNGETITWDGHVFSLIED